MIKVWRYFIMLFLPIHLLAIISTTLLPILPVYQYIVNSQIYTKISFVFEEYLNSTRNIQRWGMFSFVPTVAGQNIKIIVIDLNGKKFTFDPIIPGLHEHDEKNIRLVPYFIETVYRHDREIYITPYIQRAFKEIEKQGINIREGYLIINEKRTRYLENIRSTGIRYNEEKHEYGPYYPQR